jgi:hypothetical protein
MPATLPPPLPPLVVAYLSGDLPADPAARRAIVRRLDAAARPRGYAPRGVRVTRDAEAQTAYDVRRALYQWAHAEAERRPDDDAPSARTWGAVLGVDVAAVRGVRRLDNALAALPLRAPGRPRDEQPTTRAATTRRRRAAAAATPRKPGRPKRKQRRCGLCDGTGHDARTCPRKS